MIAVLDFKADTFCAPVFLLSPVNGIGVRVTALALFVKVFRTDLAVFTGVRTRLYESNNYSSFKLFFL